MSLFLSLCRRFTSSCPGCGHTLHSRTATQLGYRPPPRAPIPSKYASLPLYTPHQSTHPPTHTRPHSHSHSHSHTEADTEAEADTEKEYKTCMRCHILTHRTPYDLPPLLQKQNETPIIQTGKNAIVVQIVDLTDLSATMGKIQHENIIVVANKCDLIPFQQAVHEQKNISTIKSYIMKHSPNRENIKKIHVVSAKSGHNMQETVEDIFNLRKLNDTDIYFIGCVNVGKSQLINWIVTKFKDKGKGNFTISPLAGTTLGNLMVPIKSLDWLVKKRIVGGVPKGVIVDTPGIPNNQSMLPALTLAEFKTVVPKDRLRPTTYILRPGKSLWLGRYARIDFLESQTTLKDNDGAYVYFTTVVSPLLPVHVTGTDNNDRIARSPILRTIDEQEPKPEVLDPILLHSIGVEEIKDGIYNTQFHKEICFSGIGWVGVTGVFSSCKVEIFTYTGQGVHIRDPILPYLISRGKRESKSGTKLYPRLTPEKAQMPQKRRRKPIQSIGDEFKDVAMAL